MYDKCIKCTRMGESCVPNLMLLSFKDLLSWIDKRQKHLGWTNQVLADRSDVPIGTISRIKAGEYDDCYWSTMKHLLIALIGGTKDEFSCTEMVERELAQKEELVRQAAMVDGIMRENAALKAQVEFLADEVKAWRKAHTGI